MGGRIPDILKPATISTIVDTTEVAPELFFTKEIGVEQSPDRIIKWYIMMRDFGMAPIINRSAQSPIYTGDGMAEMSTSGALISEKIFITEEEINDCLNSDPIKKKASEVLVLKKLERLIHRNNLRVEWLWAQAHFKHSIIKYRDEEGTAFDVDYLFPADQNVQLTGNSVWKDGSARDPAKDMADMSRLIKLRTGVKEDVIYLTEETMNKTLREDAALQDMLKRSNFGDANAADKLFTKPLETLKDWYGKNFELYDNVYPVTCGITRVEDTTNYIVTNASILEVGAIIQFVRADPNQERLEKMAIVKAINLANNQIEIESAVTGIEAFQFIIQANVPFLKDNRLVFVVKNVGGAPSRKWIDGPVGDPSGYGIRMNEDSHFDPDSRVNRVRRLGTPAFFDTSVIGTLDIRE